MMMRNALFLFAPALLALTAFAGEPTVDQLIERLGADDYQVREDATKALIGRGAAAIPALEKAVHAEDVEVRMRAGRALRTIRESANPKLAKKRRATTPGSARGPRKEGVTQESLSMRLANGEWVITITKGTGADKTSHVYKGKSIEELKKKHPEVREALANRTFRVGVARGGMVDPFKDFDKWFEDFGVRRGRDPFDGAKDLEAEIERLRVWARWMAAQRAQRKTLDPRLRARRDAEALLLGIRVRKPESALDAQLQLRGRGLVVEKVEVETIAARLGLQRYDILLELNGQSVRSAADIRPALLSQNPKQPITAKALRRAKVVLLKETAQRAGPGNK